MKIRANLAIATDSDDITVGLTVTVDKALDGEHGYSKAVAWALARGLEVRGGTYHEVTGIAPDRA